MVNRISSERKLKRNFGRSNCELFEGLVGHVLRTSWGRPKSTSQGLSLNVRLERPLDAISRRPQDVRLGRPRDDEIGSLGPVLGTLEGDVLGASWGPIFAGWDDPDLDNILLDERSYQNILTYDFAYKAQYLKKPSLIFF